MPFFRGNSRNLEQWLNLGGLLVWADGCFWAHHRLYSWRSSIFLVAAAFAAVVSSNPLSPNLISASGPLTSLIFKELASSSPRPLRGGESQRRDYY